MIKNIFTAALCIFILGSCDEPQNEKKDDGAVPQVNIDWPSLADSPWPMFQHDPQHTGRSPYEGPKEGILEKKLLTTYSLSVPIIGFSSTIYFGALRNFYCFDYNGNLIWQKSLGPTVSTPLLSKDSILYLPHGSDYTALTQSGNLLWSLHVTESYSLGCNIDKDGNTYFVDKNGTLNVVDVTGTLLWTLTDDRFQKESGDISPAFSPDGKTVYIQGDSVSIIAIDVSSHEVKWTFGNKILLSSPAIDNAGNLYFTPDMYTAGSTHLWTFYSINENGEMNWKYDIKSRFVLDNTEATIDYNGNIYFASDTLYSFRNDGGLRWKYGFETGFNNYCSLVSDVKNTIYVAGSRGDYSNSNKVMAISMDGRLLWSIDIPDQRLLGPSPAITDNGKLIYPDWNDDSGILNIIK